MALDLFKEVIPSIAKKNYIEDIESSEVPSYILNLYYSFSIATVSYANWVNMYPMNGRMTYDFYYWVIDNPSFIKWIKSKTVSDDVDAVNHYLGCGYKTAKSYLINNLIGQDALAEIRKKYESEKQYERPQVFYGGN